MNQDHKQIYETIDELSERTRLKKSWWYSQTRQTGPGTVPRIRAGKYLLFVPSEVDEWLRSQNEAE
jgi:predicted DNA-binding transcriptional regulator AlpA